MVSGAANTIIASRPKFLESPTQKIIISERCVEIQGIESRILPEDLFAALAGMEIRAPDLIGLREGTLIAAMVDTFAQVWNERVR